MPSQATTQPDQPGVVTTQPSAASVPAGLSSGVYTIPYGNTSSFTVSVGSKTTVLVQSSAASSAGGSGSGSGSGGNGGNGGSGSGGSQSTSSSKGGAEVVRVAGGSLAGIAMFIAALF